MGVGGKSVADGSGGRRRGRDGTRAVDIVRVLCGLPLESHIVGENEVGRTVAKTACTHS